MLSRSRNTAGFTLVELILSMTIVIIMGSSLAMITYTAAESMSLAFQWGKAFEEGQRAGDQMYRELLHVGTGDITSAGATSLSFTDANSQATDFHISSGVVYRDTEVLAERISSLSFLYYDSAGNTTTTAADVRLIEIEMTVDVGDHGSIPMQFMVYPRQFHYTSFQ